ncbi:hypothetical protein PENSPDRAFT_661428 [Peniophora sp. CONT]|nr:hypothetical protein PENSPDRAFT_661428 [Peniophora sp. CONT]
MSTPPCIDTSMLTGLLAPPVGETLLFIITSGFAERRKSVPTDPDADVLKTLLSASPLPPLAFSATNLLQNHESQDAEDIFETSPAIRLREIFFPVRAPNLQEINLWFSESSSRERPVLLQLLEVIDACAGSLAILSIRNAIDPSDLVSAADKAPSSVTLLPGLHLLRVVDASNTVNVFLKRLEWNWATVVTLSMHTARERGAAKHCLVLTFVKLLDKRPNLDNYSLQVFHRASEEGACESELRWYPTPQDGEMVVVGSVSVTVRMDGVLSWEDILESFSIAHLDRKVPRPAEMSLMVPDEAWTYVDWVLIDSALKNMGRAKRVYPLKRLLGELCVSKGIPSAVSNRLYFLLFGASAIEDELAYSPLSESPLTLYENTVFDEM